MSLFLGSRDSLNIQNHILQIPEPFQTPQDYLHEMNLVITDDLYFAALRIGLSCDSDVSSQRDIALSIPSNEFYRRKYYYQLYELTDKAFQRNFNISGLIYVVDPITCDKNPTKSLASNQANMNFYIPNSNALRITNCIPVPNVWNYLLETNTLLGPTFEFHYFKNPSEGIYETV